MTSADLIMEKFAKDSRQQPRVLEGKLAIVTGGARGKFSCYYQHNQKDQQLDENRHWSRNITQSG